MNITYILGQTRLAPGYPCHYFIFDATRPGVVKFSTGDFLESIRTLHQPYNPLCGNCIQQTHACNDSDEGFICVQDMFIEEHPNII